MKKQAEFINSEKLKSLAHLKKESVELSLTRCGYEECNAGYIGGPHKKSYYTLFAVTDGESVSEIDGIEYHFKKNDFVYFPMGAKYSSIFTTTDEDPMEYNAIYFGFISKDSKGEVFKLSDDLIILSEATRKNYKNRMFEIAYMISLNKPPVLIKVKLLELLTDISIDLKEKNKSSDYLRIADGVKFIEENFDKKITAKDAAEEYFSKLNDLITSYDYMVSLWGEFDADLLRIKDIDITMGKIAGVKIPVLRDVIFEEKQLM